MSNAWRPKKELNNDIKKLTSTITGDESMKAKAEEKQENLNWIVLQS